MDKDIKVLQIIDSLDAGGAEMMAVNITNLLNKNKVDCHLCVSNKAGILSEKLLNKDKLIVLNKRSRFDLNAILKLFSYIKKNKINVIHAHSSSFILGYLVKIRFKSLKLIWHDHYGMADDLGTRSKGLISFCSRQFDRIIVVNNLLKKWSETFYDSMKIHFFNNFSILSDSGEKDASNLKGNHDYKIICLASFRPQKDHLTLLQAFFSLTSNSNISISLHLVGTSLQDAYYRKIISYIEEHDKDKNVFVYPPTNNVKAVLSQADIGVLSSISEGLPLALIEYGLAKLPVVATNVGQCKDVIGSHGILIEKGNSEQLADALNKYITDSKFRNKTSKDFYKRVLDNFSEDKYYKELIELYIELFD